MVGALPKGTPLRQQAVTLLSELEDLQSYAGDDELSDSLEFVTDNLPGIELLAEHHYGFKGMCKHNLASTRVKAEGVVEMPAGPLNAEFSESMINKT